MCTHPIRIRNRKIDFNVCNDKKWLYVPCGHCVECLNQYRNGYVLRAYFEFLQTVSEGGSCFFYTLTYNNENLPKTTVRFNPSYHSPVRPVGTGFVLSPFVERYDLKEVPCFDKKEVQKFLRRLDMRISRAYGCRLRYFLTSEFGERKKRPHYHVLFYTSRFIEPFRFRKLLRDTWYFGFIKAGDNFGCVQNINAVRYVAKYVAKDVTGCPLLFYGSDEEERGNILPFHLQSQGFGLYAIQNLNVLQKQFGFVHMSSQNEKVFNVTLLPTYLLRKLYYTTVKNSNGTNSYVLNEMGKIRALSIFSKQYRDISENITDFYNKGFPHDSEFNREFGKFLSSKFEASLDDFSFSDLFDSVTNGDKKSFIDFRLILRGRSVILPYSSAIDSMDLYKSFLSPCELPFEDSSHEIFYDDLPQFSGYSKLCEIYDFIETYKHYLNYKKLLTKYNSIQIQRANSHLYDYADTLTIPTFLDYINI